MANELITIVAPAIRTKWWLELHDTFTTTNDTSFKMIFVGHVVPDFKLPDNFKYIYSRNTPAACTEIAFRNVDTEYVMNIADDYDPSPQHFSPHLLDKLLDEHKRVESLGIEHFFVGPSFCLGPQEEFKTAIPLIYWNEDHKSPLLTLSPLTKLKTNRLLGGVDSSFHSMYWDTDLNMRLYDIGGQAKVMGMKFKNDIWSEDQDNGEFIRVTERDVTEGRSSMKELGLLPLSLRNRNFDNQHFRRLWNPVPHGTTLEDGRHYVNNCQRNSPFVPFPKDLK